jgi:hypothetical protein
VHAIAVGRDVEPLAGIAQIDLEGVVARAAFGNVAVISRIPDDTVVAGAAKQLVVAVAADQHVVAGTAEQQIIAALAVEDVVAGLAEQLIGSRAAGDRVVAGAAEQIGGRQCAVGFIERDRVVAGLAEHLDQAGVGDRGRAALNRHGSVVDENGPGCVAAGNDRIVELVSEHVQLAGGCVELGSDCHRLLLSIFRGECACSFRLQSWCPRVTK